MISATDNIGHNHIGSSRQGISHMRYPYQPRRYRPYYICHTMIIEL